MEEIVQIALFDAIGKMADVDSWDGETACSQRVNKDESQKNGATFILAWSRFLHYYPDRADSLAVELFDGLLGALRLEVLYEGEVIFHQHVDDVAVSGEHLEEFFPLYAAV